MGLLKLDYEVKKYGNESNFNIIVAANNEMILTIEEDLKIALDLDSFKELKEKIDEINNLIGQ